MLKPFFALPKGNLGVSALCDVAKDHHMPAGQIVCSSGEVHEKRRSIIRDELRTASSILVLKKRVPSLPKRTIRKEMTDIPADQLIDRNSQDSRRRGIRVQTIALVINDHDSVEYILEDG